MYLVRDIFRCRPGQAKEIAERFRRVFAVLRERGEPGAGRVLVDFVASYWTIVIESEVADLGEFERHMKVWGEIPEIAAIMKGYLDLVEGGHREIFRIVE